MTYNQSIKRRVAKVERRIGMERGEIKRQFFVVCGPKPKTEAGQAAQDAEIERRKQEAIDRDPHRKIHYISFMPKLLPE